MKQRTAIIVLVMAMLAITGQVTAVSPYTTWTLGPGGYFFPTQDAYVPRDEILLPVSGPEDMFFAPDGFLYIADTGNGRILKLDSAFEIAAEFGVGVLESPTGVFVDEAGTLYIADAGKNAIVMLDGAGALLDEFGRPTEPLYGANREFLPRKIAVDARDNLYIVSEGSVDGLAMMNTEGNFIGYFGANAADMSLKMVLQRLFLNEEQLDQFIRNEAASPSNIAIDSQSLVYSITAGTDRARSLRKFTVSGRNLFDWTFGSNSFRDIHASADGLLVAVNAEGTIYEYDLNGTLLFFFGATDRGDQRLGLLSNPTAIERVGDELYVLDKDKNAIVTYRVTDFARRLHDGVRLYMEGFYTEARPYFEEVLTYNGLVLMAYQAIADADYNTGDYASALEFYRYAGDRDGYSETSWELRNAVLQRNLGGGLVFLIVGWVGVGTFNRLERRYRWLEPIRRGVGAARRIRLVDDFAFLFRFIRKPVDSFYYLKQNERGSLLFALLIYVWIVIARVLTIYLTGFVFSPYTTPWEIRIETEIAYLVIPLVLWNIANYLIATISDGEGSLRQVIIGGAYSLFPYVLFAVPIALLSNVLTLNEVFLYSFSNQAIVLWSGIMLVIMVKEIHNFTVSETVRNILTTLFTMAMFMLSAYILYVLFSQLFEFIGAVVQEVRLNG